MIKKTTPVKAETSCKDLLKWYHYAEKELALVEEEIARAGQMQDTVRGSMQEFPYVEHAITVSGPDPELIRLLCEKRHRLRALRTQVERFLAMIDDPMIGAAVRLRYIKGMSWQRVANHMGNMNQANTIRMAVERYLNELESLDMCI